MPASIRRITITALPVLLAASLANAPAGAELGQGELEVRFIRHLTGASPFTDGCGDLNPEAAIVDSEVEPHLSVNPANPNHLLATWQQDRYGAGGGARSDLVAVSTDGGSSWTGPIGVPGISSCTGHPTFTRASDPWGAIGPDGTAYHGSLAFTLDATADPDDAEQVNVSADGGFTWRPEPAVIKGPGGMFMEKLVMAADPVKPGHAYYAYWVEDWELGTNTDAVVKLSRTEDFGSTWTEPVRLPPDIPGMWESPIDVVPIPRPDGGTTLIVPMWIADYASGPRGGGLGPNTFVSIRSEDLGETWTAPSPIATHVRNITRGDAEDIKEILLGYPSVDLAPNGDLFMAWAENDPPGSPVGTAIRMARSTDQGDTWTTSTVATGIGIGSLASLAVAGDGTVGVTWYDSRNEALGDDEFTTDYWFASSTDEGETWEELHVAGPFDMRRGPLLGARIFLGDYAGLVGFPTGFGALFPMAPGDEGLASEVVGSSDLFYARIERPTIGGPGDPPGRGAKVTGGGTVPGAGGGSASFGLVAQESRKGNLTFRDNDAGVTVTALSIDSLSVSETPTGAACTIGGTARVSGPASTATEAFTATCEDNGEPGRDDVFEIVTETYSGGGTLTGGNIQIH